MTTLKQLIHQPGGSLSFALVGSSSARVAETFAAAGYDFIMVDLEHGSDDPAIIDPTLDAIEAAGAYTALKARSQSAEDLRIAYDFAPSAIYVPNTSSAAEVRAYAETFAQLRQNTPRRGESRDVALVALIESRQGIDEAAEIAAIEGVDALGIGLFDLSRDLGVPGEVNHPKVLQAYDDLLAVGRSTGIRVGVGGPGASKEQFDAWREQGNGMELGTIDLLVLREGAEAGMQLVQSTRQL